MPVSTIYATLWRYRLFISVSTAIMVAAAFFVVSTQTKLYTASSLIRIQYGATNANDIYGALQTGGRLAQTYAQIAQTSSVANSVRERLPASIPSDAININATQVGDLELLNLSVTYRDPKIAGDRRKRRTRRPFKLRRKAGSAAGHDHADRARYGANVTLLTQRQADAGSRTPSRSDLQQRPCPSSQCPLGSDRQPRIPRTLDRAPGDRDDPHPPIRRSQPHD